MGVDRLALLKYGVDDLQYFFREMCGSCSSLDKTAS